MNMLGRIMRLDLAIDWTRLAPVIVLTILAAVLPVGLPLILGHAIDAALHGANVVQVLPLLGLAALLSAGGAVAEVLANSLGAPRGSATACRGNWHKSSTAICCACRN